MNVEFTGRQGCHKTHSLVIAMCELVTVYGFSPSKCFGNVAVDLPGFQFLRNKELLGLIRHLYLDIGEAVDSTGHILLIDEVEQVIPARGFRDAEQTKLATGFWQDEKMENVNLWTSHPGVATTDAIFRAATPVTVLPSYCEETDVLHWQIINGNLMEVFERDIPGASYFYQLYDRRARVW